MTQRIIYPTDSGIAVIIPAPGASETEVARKDVPHGVPYLIIDQSDLPNDREFRNAWEADFSAPYGHGLGARRWHIETSGDALAALVAPTEPQTLIPDAIDRIVWTGDLTEERKQALYNEYLDRIAGMNAMLADVYASALANYQTRHAHLVALIAQMKSEVFEIEGVQL